MADRFCFNLKFCFPMFAHHHMCPKVLEMSGFGRFHCPCGRVCSDWRTRHVALAIDGTTKPFFGEEKEDCIDFCGGGTNDVYSTLDELMIHLETGSSGPMHHAAAAFLRKLYYTK